MKRILSTAALAATASGLLTLTNAPALAQGAGDFHNRPMRFVVGYPPGGATDIIARIVGQKVGDSTGQNVLIDNRPGAGGILGTEIVAKATPDGYSFVLVTTSHGINPSLYPKLPYDSVKDFTPISQIATLQQVLVVSPSLGVSTLKELIALAKAQPGKLNFASSGSGQALHLSGELLKSMAGINIVHIPYKGSAPAITDLLGGQTQQLTFGTVGAVSPHIKSGRLRALAVTSAQPSVLVPGLPTVAASGLPGYEAGAIYVMFAPAKTPAAIINRVNQDTQRVLRQPDIREKFLASGVEVAGGSPEDLAATVKSEMAKLGKVIREAHIRAE